MFSDLCDSIDSRTETRLAEQRCPWARLAGATFAGTVVGCGALSLLALGTYLVAFDPKLFAVVIALAFVSATAVKYVLGSRMFTTVALVMPIEMLRGTNSNRELTLALAVTTAGNFAGATLVATVAYHMGWIGDSTLLGLIVERKTHASSLTLFAQGLLCNWALMMAAWTWARIKHGGARAGLMLVGFFFFVCSGYEHSVVNTALFVTAKFAAPDFAWADAVLTLLPVTLGNVLSGSLASLSGYYAMRAPSQIPRLR